MKEAFSALTRLQGCERTSVWEESCGVEHLPVSFLAVPIPLNWHPECQERSRAVVLCWLVLSVSSPLQCQNQSGCVASVGCHWKQAGPFWARSRNQAMPVGQSVLCRLCWLQSASVWDHYVFWIGSALQMVWKSIYGSKLRVPGCWKGRFCLLFILCELKYPGCPCIPICLRMCSPASQVQFKRTKFYLPTVDFPACPDSSLFGDTKWSQRSSYLQQQPAHFSLIWSSGSNCQALLSRTK